MRVFEVQPNILNGYALSVIKVNLPSWIAIRRPVDFSPRIHFIKRLWRILPMLAGWRHHALPRFAGFTVPDAWGMYRNLLVAPTRPLLNVGVFLLRSFVCPQFNSAIPNIVI